MVRKGFIAALVLAAAAASAFAGPQKDKGESGMPVVKVGLVGEEIAHAWKKAAEVAAAAGVKVEFVNFSDYETPNRALADGEIDLNSFQHYAFFEDQVATHKYALSSAGDTVIYFMGVYSNKIDSLDKLQDGDTIVVMNDATNEGRALKVLESACVITLDPSKGNTPTVADITSNAKSIKIVEVEAPMVYRSIDDPQVAAVVSNSTYVTDAGADPQSAIFGKEVNLPNDKPYINMIAVRTADKDKKAIKTVVASFQSPEVEQVILNEKPSAGVALPAWK